MDPVDRRIICKVCLRQYARYTCPRCNTGYCSLPCYKQHGESCTESFYREQAVGEMQSVRAADEQRRAMLDILRRVHEQQLEEEERQRPLLEALMGLGVAGEAEAGRGSGSEGDGEGDEEDDDWEGEAGSSEGEAEERDDGGSRAGGSGPAGTRGGGGGGGGGWGPLEALLSEETRQRLLRKAAASASADEWDIEEGDLQPEEWRAFQRAVALGQLGGALEPWQPWWTFSEARELNLTATGQRRVAPLSEVGGSGGGGGGDEGDEAANGGGGLPPPPSEPLPPLSALTRAAPSPLLTWHLVEVLYGYCYVMRRYNGDWGQNAGAAAAALLALTDVLSGVPMGRRPTRRDPAAASQGGRAAAGRASGPGRGQAEQAGDDDDEDGDGEDGGGRGAPAAQLPQTAAEACLHGVERACAPPMGTSRDRSYAVSVLYDVVTVLDNGRPSVVLALEDSRRMLLRAAGAGAAAPPAPLPPPSASKATTTAPPPVGAAASASAAPPPPSAPRGHSRRATAGVGKSEAARLKAAERKLWFFLVWANQLVPEQLQQVAGLVAAEWQVLHSTVVAGTGAPGAATARGSTATNKGSAMGAGGGLRLMPDVRTS